MIASTFLLLASASFGSAAYLDRRQASSSSSALPDYLVTSTEVYPGPTATGPPAFLAQTNPAPFSHGASATYAPNTPLETALPISGNTNNTSIFTLMGQLCSYFPNPTGFGVDEYALPPGANITLLNMLSRHGSRYPTNGSSVATFGAKIPQLVKNGTKFTGALSFLNTWSYQLGDDILVPVGRSELFQSGVLHNYGYAGLYNTSTKLLARTTSQDRMLKSAEYFLAGFFGLEWTRNASIEVIIENIPFNNSLAGYENCNNSNNYLSTGGNNASLIWEGIYLANATQRLKSLAGGYNWTLSDTYIAQQMCPYETVAYGYSAWCDLFTFAEWQGYEYSVDLQFYGNDMFGSPTGRAVGVGYAQELYARLQHHVVQDPAGTSSANLTLDGNNSTFQLNQTLYFDFSHDTNIASILTAFGMTQFAQYLPPTGPPANQQMIVSHMEPFGARLDIEVIKTPQPLKDTRPTAANATFNDFYNAGNATTYVHFVQNQRTIPLGKSYGSCGQRDDGWCEIGVFLQNLEQNIQLAQYDLSCNGHYAPQQPGNITNGVPIQ